MVDFSTNPQNLMTITPSIVPRVARSWEPPGGGGGTTRPKLVAGSGGIVAHGQNVPDLGGPCDLSPCSPFPPFDGRITYILDGHSGDPKSGVSGKRRYVRVDLVVRHTLKQKT